MDGGGGVTRQCCCGGDPTDCCEAGGDDPYWFNRYCIQVTGFDYFYEECNCRDASNDCQDCPEPADCGEGCKACCRQEQLTLCAGGALFRSPLFHPGPPGPENCDTTADDPFREWGVDGTTPSICDTSPYAPPNYDSSVSGQTSVYTSPPCDCTLAQNDRLRWKGVVRNETVTQCCDQDDYNEPIDCYAGQAVIECAESSCDTAVYPCCQFSQSKTRLHYLKVSTQPVWGAWGECSCSEYLPPITFIWAAELGPFVGPHLAKWTLIGVEFFGQCQVAQVGLLPCQEPECCLGSCCDTSCEGFQCELCDSGQGTCRNCRDETYQFPNVQLFVYQSCEAPC